MSVPVSVIDPPAWVEELDAGDELVVLGHGPAPVLPGRGRDRIPGGDRGRGRVPGHDRRRSSRCGRRVEALLEALDA